MAICRRLFIIQMYIPNQYRDDWLTKPLSKEIIQDVDKSEVVSANLIDSPVLGAISPKELSGGVKTLLLMAMIRAERSLTHPLAEIIAQNGFYSWGNRVNL